MNLALPREPPPKAGWGTGCPGAGATEPAREGTPATGEALSRTVGLMRGSVHIWSMKAEIDFIRTNGEWPMLPAGSTVMGLPAESWGKGLFVVVRPFKGLVIDVPD